MNQRQSRSSGRASDTIASFLLKTYEILEHSENKKMICWDKDDVGFIVLDVVAFTKEILPKYFRHSNFSSFVRQLNMYDFHKVKQENDSLVFKNPLFCKGEQQKLRLIKRKASKKSGDHPRRLYPSDKNNSENQKYANSLKWLKKSMESEINQSCIFFQKSLDLLKENNDSNKQKEQLFTKLKLSPVSPSLDLLFSLREECQRQFSRSQRWLDEQNEVFKRKLKSISSFSVQLSIARKDPIILASDEELKLQSQGYLKDRSKE